MALSRTRTSTSNPLGHAARLLVCSTGLLALIAGCGEAPEQECPVGSDGCYCASGSVCEQGLSCIDKLCLQAISSGNAGSAQDGAATQGGAVDGDPGDAMSSGAGTAGANGNTGGATLGGNAVNGGAGSSTETGGAGTTPSATSGGGSTGVATGTVATGGSAAGGAGDDATGGVTAGGAGVGGGGDDATGGVTGVGGAGEDATGGVAAGGEATGGVASSGSESGEACVPLCTSRTCGDDPVCGTSCGTCSPGYECSSDRGGATCVAETQTLDVTATADNLLVINSQDASTQNTAYSSNELGVGCNWLYSDLTGIQDFVCAISLLYFDTDATLAGHTILGATLVLEVDGFAATPTDYSLWATYDDWSGGVTWNTAPSVVAGTEQAVSPPGLTTWEMDVTSIVQGWANGTYQNYGFFLEPADVLFPYATSFEATTMCSLEGCPGTFRPRLVVEYR